MAEIGEIYELPLGKEDEITLKGNYPTRRKYCVIIGKPDYGYYVAYLIIDHEINEKFNPTRELKDCFFPLAMQKGDCLQIFTCGGEDKTAINTKDNTFSNIVYWNLTEPIWFNPLSSFEIMRRGDSYSGTILLDPFN